MRIPRHSENQFDIAMTPLIDMMFLLIIFFIVSTAFVDPEKDLTINLPETSDAEAAKEGPDEFIINVTQGGTLVLKERVITLDDLEKRLLEAAKKRPNQIVKIRGDRKAYLEKVVGVLQACTKAKLRTVSVVTRPGL